MNQRILELALEALTARKAAIETEIETLKRGLSRPPRAPIGAAKAPKQAHPMRSAAARKAQSEKMKAYWAKRKSVEAKKTRGRKR